LANNNLGELGRLTIMDMQKTKGIGEARAITICAALELGRRRQMSDVLMRQTISSSRDAAEILVPALQDLSNEVFYVLYLNQSNKLLRQETLSSGGMTATVVDIRMILKNALLHNANKLIVAHNHPSGSLLPSREDKDITQRLKNGGELMDIKLIDHLIVGGNKYLSFADEGLL
jgi:DNA repair protein RadC